MRKVLRRHRPTMVIVGLLLLAGLFPAGPGDLRLRLAGIFAPLAWSRSASDGAVLEPESAAIARLREEIDELRVHAVRLERERESLLDFRGLDLPASHPGATWVPGRVVGRDRAWPLRRSLLVDRGTRHGVRRGQPVVVGRSLAGFIVEAGPSFSTVRLIDDPGGRGALDLRVGVEVLPPEPVADRPHGVEGALIGAGRGQLTLKMIPAGTVHEGDLVATSTADPRVPAGLLVGRVGRVTDLRRAGLAEAAVTPTADLAALRTVMIVRVPVPEDRPDRDEGR